MEFANDMLNLRREIDNMSAARAAMMNGLHNFSFELRKGMAQKMSEVRGMLAPGAHGRAVRRAFNSHNRRMVGEMIAAFGGERSAARRNFLGRSK